MIKLYDYFRSTASYRVRIALNLKNLAHEKIAVNLIKDGGEQLKAEYLQNNPQGLVPTLVDGSFNLTQSLAILEYLEEKYPQPNLLPTNMEDRARVRSIAQLIACDIHPLNNLRVLQYLTSTGGFSEKAKLSWYKHWVKEGFTALEQLLNRHNSNGKFCVGTQPTIADICLVAQMYNANRFECPLQNYPTIVAINQHCCTLPAFRFD